MTSYTEVRPYLLEAFANVVRRDYNIYFGGLLINLDGSGGAISLDRAVAYVAEWHNVSIFHLVASIWMEADRLRWKLSEAYIEQTDPRFQ